MKRALCFFAVALSLFVGTYKVFAEARAPQLVITAFVEAIQKDDMAYLKKYVDLDKIINQPRHGYSIEQLKKLFVNVDIKKIECSRPVYDKKTKRVRIRLDKPISLNFEIQHQNTWEGKGDFYRIVGIHP